MFTINKNIQAALDNPKKVTQIILQIDDVATIYSSVKVKKIPRFDDGYVFDEEGLFFDTPIVDIGTKDYISPTGSTKQITQQMEQDKGGTTSITSVNISIVDKNKEVSNELSFLEMLARGASIFLSFEGLEHPSDSIRIVSGIISSYMVQPGEVKITVSSPHALEKQKIFVPFKSELIQLMNDSQNYCYVPDENFLLSFPLYSGPMRWLAKIDDEIIYFDDYEIDGTGAKIKNITRGFLSTTDAAHDSGADFEMIYRLIDYPIDLALKILMSNSHRNNFAITNDDRYLTSTKPSYYNSFSIPNSIHFNDYDIEESLGLTIGDFVKVVDSTSNDMIDVEIIGIGRNDNNTSYIVVNSFVATEAVTGATVVSFKSKYNVMYDGCGLTTKQVDVARFEEIKRVFGSQLPEMTFYLDEDIEVKKFIEEQILFPIGAFSLMRSGRISIGFTSPAIGQEGQITLGIDNVIKPESVYPTRSINKNFYNSVVFKFEKSPIDGKYKANRITYSADSTNRIKTGNRPLQIESDGLRKDNAIAYIDSVSSNLLERYRYAADSIKVETMFSVGFPLEVGDVVIFDGRDLGIYDSESGETGTYIRQMEITNKALDFSTGKVTLDLLSTNYLTDSRYAFIGPASVIRSVSGNKITLEKSFGTDSFTNESNKWQKYIGDQIRIHNDEFTLDEHVTINSISSSENDVIFISTPTITVTAGMTITCPEYTEASDTFKKLIFYTTPRVLVVASADSTHIEVSGSDIGKFFEGCKIDVMLANYSDYQELITVSDIIGNILTLETPLDFALSSGDIIDRIGFASDEGDSYTII